VTEIELGNLAREKSTDTEVRNYAQSMIDEHTATQTELRSIGETKRLTVQNQLNELNQEKKNQLSALSGPAFDRAYMRSQVADHQVTSGKFATEIDQGRDNELKAYANKHKPAIDRHLQRAQTIVISRGY